MTAPQTAPALSFEQKVAERRAQLVASARTELLDERGHPVPPQEVVKRLPPGASIKWIPAAGFYGTAYFALLKDWEPNDPRWRRVQSGEYPREDARDIVQMFPRECSVSDMAAYVEQRWGYRNNSPADAAAAAEKYISEAAAIAHTTEQANIDRVVEQSNERSARESRHDLRVRAGADTPTPMVTVAAGFDGPKRLIAKD